MGIHQNKIQRQEKEEVITESNKMGLMLKNHRQKSSGTRSDNRCMTGNVNIYICSETIEKDDKTEANFNEISKSDNFMSTASDDINNITSEPLQSQSSPPPPPPPPPPNHLEKDTGTMNDVLEKPPPPDQFGESSAGIGIVQSKSDDSSIKAIKASLDNSNVKLDDNRHDAIYSKIITKEKSSNADSQSNEEKTIDIKSMQKIATEKIESNIQKNDVDSIKDFAYKNDQRISSTLEKVSVDGNIPRSSLKDGKVIRIPSIDSETKARNQINGIKSMDETLSTISEKRESSDLVSCSCRQFDESDVWLQNIRKRSSEKPNSFNSGKKFSFHDKTIKVPKIARNVEKPGGVCTCDRTQNKKQIPRRHTLPRNVCAKLCTCPVIIDEKTNNSVSLAKNNLNTKVVDRNDESWRTLRKELKENGKIKLSLLDDGQANNLKNSCLEEEKKLSEVENNVNVTDKLKNDLNFLKEKTSDVETIRRSQSPVLKSERKSEESNRKISYFDNVDRNSRKDSETKRTEKKMKRDSQKSNNNIVTDLIADGKSEKASNESTQNSNDSTSKRNSKLDSNNSDKMRKSSKLRVKSKRESAKSDNVLVASTLEGNSKRNSQNNKVEDKFEGILSSAIIENNVGDSILQIQSKQENKMKDTESKFSPSLKDTEPNKENLEKKRKETWLFSRIINLMKSKKRKKCKSPTRVRKAKCSPSCTTLLNNTRETMNRKHKKRKKKSKVTGIGMNNEECKLNEKSFNSVCKSNVQVNEEKNAEELKVEIIFDAGAEDEKTQVENKNFLEEEVKSIDYLKIEDNKIRNNEFENECNENQKPNTTVLQNPNCFVPFPFNNNKLESQGQARESSVPLYRNNNKTENQHRVNSKYNDEKIMVTNKIDSSSKVSLHNTHVQEEKCTCCNNFSQTEGLKNTKSDNSHPQLCFSCLYLLSNCVCGEKFLLCQCCTCNTINHSIKSQENWHFPNRNKPCGSDVLPYQRLTIYPNIVNELQQKMGESNTNHDESSMYCCCETRVLRQERNYESQNKYKFDNNPF